MRRAIREADIVVINGEGTLHHGRRRARWLIDAIEYAKARNKPVALVNALYQDNPDLWNPIVRQLDIIYARDALSASQLSVVTARRIEYMGDLALYDEALSSFECDRSGMLFGDSVHIKTTRHLLATAGKVSKFTPARIMPIIKRCRIPNSRRSAAFGLQTIYTYYCHRRAPRYRSIVSFAVSQHAYIEALKGFALSVTGRFHALCFALLTGTPFVAVASNSWKMDAIINDAGLNRNRLLAPHALTPEIILDNDWSYSAEERDAIARYIETSRAKARKLFLSLHSLVGSAPVCEL
ncbi:MAG: polysaccharide pyruvyl transferase family protein [Wenzhouxiangellaceae bacterium]|nr:polysaccharide pyruvyl transferase family protein [Wenzhouxiangellaceae bacterium]